MGGLLDYVPGNSVFHRLNPLTKLIFPFLLCIACFLTDSHLFVLGILALDFVIAAVCGIMPRALAMFRTLVLLSLVLFLLQIFFVRDGNKILTLPLNIYITDRGLSFSLLVVLRLIAATMPLALMLSVTQMNELSGALVSVVGIPYKYAFALTTAIRFIPLFAGEMSAIVAAQTARGVEFDTRSPGKKIRLILPLCVPLLVSSVKKIDAGAISAELRGFNRRTRKSSSKAYPFSGADALVGVASIGIFVLSMML